jgi:hypothetical protein
MGMKKSSGSRTPSYLSFDRRHYPWKADIDYRKHPEQYRVGKGEQGFLICNPYKSEIGQHWRFKTPAIAEKSSAKILAMFRRYMRDKDFVGADMARKFLQMGYTRARRYANYKGGRKYDKKQGYALAPRGTGERSKALSAAIFHRAWKAAESHERYAAQKAAWKKTYG